LYKTTKKKQVAGTTLSTKTQDFLGIRFLFGTHTNAIMWKTPEIPHFWDRILHFTLINSRRVESTLKICPSELILSGTVE